MTQNSHEILVVGASGMLGAQIASNLLQRGASVRLLQRQETPSDPAKRARQDGLVASGAKIIVGDLSDPTSLDLATKGVTCVVSAVQGGPDVIISGQLALAKAAAANGVKRIIPSDYSVDFFKLPEGSHPNLDIRRVASRKMGELPIEVTNVLIGGFMEIVFGPQFQLVHADKAEIAYFGDADTLFDVTTIADAAAFAAQAALHKGAIPGPFAFAGETASFTDLAQILTDVRGATYRLMHRGAVADLEAYIAGEQAAGRAMTWPTLGAQYAWTMMSGQAQLTQKVTPDFTPMRIHEFLAEPAKDPRS
jgi:nucleoside-diphosphate-sugar epimerase